ncbi:hypothetical protein [Ponticaulis profundi]
MLRQMIVGLSCFVLPFTAGCSEALEPVAPVKTEIQVDGESWESLEGWVPDSKDWAPKRLIRRTDGYSTAVIANVKRPELDAITDASRFEEALRFALSLEGVRDVRMNERLEVTGDIAQVFRDVIGTPKGRFFAWIASGTGDAGRMKAAGLSFVTSEDGDPGTSMEFFLASEAEYEHLGGVIVPLAHLLDVTFSDPNPPAANVLAFGRQSDEEAAERLRAHFEQFMIETAMIRAQAGMLQQNTLSILQGLNQVEPYGLQDPMWDF